MPDGPRLPVGKVPSAREITLRDGRGRRCDTARRHFSLAGRCESFAASARNGIDTGSWGPYDATFAYAYPVPDCADGSKPKR